MLKNLRLKTLSKDRNRKGVPVPRLSNEAKRLKKKKNLKTCKKRKFYELE